MDKLQFRSTEEVEKDIAAKIAEADQLKAKAQTEEGLTDEEKARLDELVAEIEKLQAEAAESETQERFIAVKHRQDEKKKLATRSAPIFKSSNYTNNNAKPTDVIGAFINRGSWTPEVAYQCRSMGINPDDNYLHIPMDWSKISASNDEYANRSKMNTGGVGYGKEYVWEAFDNKFIHWFKKPGSIASLVNIDTEENGGVTKSYFIADTRTNIASDSYSSGGSEEDPNIPQNIVSTSARKLGTVPVNSGYYMITRELMKMASSAVDIEGLIKNTAAESMAHRLEQKIILGTDTDGEDDFQGIKQASYLALDIGSSELEDKPDALEYFTSLFPEDHLEGAILLSNRNSKQTYRRVARDLHGADLFGKTQLDTREYESVFDIPWVTSSFIPEGEIYYVHPKHFTLRAVNGFSLEYLTEKFHPDYAWFIMGMFGFGFLGLSGAGGTCQRFKFTPTTSF